MSEEDTSRNYKERFSLTVLEGLVVWQLIKDVSGSSVLELFQTAASGPGGCADASREELTLATQGEPRQSSLFKRNASAEAQRLLQSVEDYLVSKRP